MNRIRLLMKIEIALLLVLFSYSTQARDTCAYIAKETPDIKNPEWQPYQRCATYTEGKLKINSQHIRAIQFDASGLARFWVSGQNFYVRENGDYLPVITYDNGADYFEEGLVRSLVNAKIAYFNKAFQMVIPPKYDWGWPFNNGRALVCSGCKVAEPSKNGHKPVLGGRWGYIDKKGKEVIPVKYTKDALPKE